MNRYKRISYIWIIVLIIFLIFHFIIYFNFTNKVYPSTDKNTVGDLARMGYFTDIIQERNNLNNLEKKHIEIQNYNNDKIDILTIGDSFSNGMGGGLNSYYQDYLATIYNKNILNINSLKIEDSKNYIETISLFLNSGFLDKMEVKYIIIESIQREAIDRFSNKNINFGIKTDFLMKDIFSSSPKGYNLEEFYENRPTIINNLNLNALIYSIKYYIKEYGKMNSNVYIEKLDRDFFSSKSDSKLAFFHDDIKKLSLETRENIELLNNNFNTLAKILKNKNIKLIFMPVVDKYNLYKPYIVSNEYQESIFFEYLRNLSKDYIFIDTKKILSEELKKNTKDLFYSDDTHWSYKASEIIVRDKIFGDLFKFEEK